MKILNLDKLNRAPERQLTIDGVDYPIQPLSVEGFIETTRAVEKIVTEGGSPAAQLDVTIDMILRQVPTLPREKLTQYTPETLEVIVKFIRGEDVEGAEQAAEGEAGK